MRCFFVEDSDMLKFKCQEVEELELSRLKKLGDALVMVASKVPSD